MPSLQVLELSQWHARRRLAGGAKAVGELGGDAWSGAGTVVGLGRRGNGSGWRRCCAAEEAEEEEEGGRGAGANLQFPKILGTSL
jgi:hypothetical protein